LSDEDTCRAEINDPDIQRTMPKPFTVYNVPRFAHDKLALRVQDIEHAVHLRLMLWILMLIVINISSVGSALEDLWHLLAANLI
jgi:hypothetical protein